MHRRLHSCRTPYQVGGKTYHARQLTELLFLTAQAAGLQSIKMQEGYPSAPVIFQISDGLLGCLRRTYHHILGAGA